MVGLFLGWIFRNFPLKSPGVNVSMESVAIWASMMLSWLWVSQESGLLGTTSPVLPTSFLDISGLRLRDGNHVHLLSIMDTANLWHLLARLSVRLLLLNFLFNSSLCWSSRFLYFSSSGGEEVLFLFFWLRVKQLGRAWRLSDKWTCEGCAGLGCLASYSNDTEWGRCRVTQARPASFHRRRGGGGGGGCWRGGAGLRGAVWKWIRGLDASYCNQ